MTSKEAMERQDELQKAIDEANTPEAQAKARSEMIEFRKLARFCVLDDEAILSVTKNDNGK